MEYQAITQNRRLAAIMFTDMVGYSALMQEDESAALDLLEEHRQILRPFFPIHGGREVEAIGDAFFVEFASALEAVNCAIDIQKVLWERNKGLPSNKQIKIRIGIHLGDVVSKGANVLGDEVNIAARIEPLAQSCGICVSEDVARQVQNKIDFPLKKMEPKHLKNIQLPIAVYSVELSWLSKSLVAKKLKKHTKLLIIISFVILTSVLVLLFNNPFDSLNTEQIYKPVENEWQNSIAVLPFTDLSPEKDQEYFCDGMTEQIITNLARLNSLKVIARTSVMKFKNTDKTIPEIGAELDVKAVLEGSIRKFNNRIRITVQLINSNDGSHIWAEDYDREYKELFAIQDEISRSVADSLSKELSRNQVDNIKTKRTINIDAYEKYLKAEYIHNNRYWSGYDIQDFKESEQLFIEAIELDKSYAPSYAGLVDLYNTYWNTQELGALEKNKYLKLQEKYIKIAYMLDSGSPDVNRVMGWVYGAKQDIKNKIKFIKRAVQLDSNNPENVRALGIFYDNIGLKNLAYYYYNRCIELDPYDAKYYFYSANIHFNLGQFKKAKAGFEKALKLEPNDPKYLMRYIWLLFQMENYQDAENFYLKYNQLYPDTREHKFLQVVRFASRGENQKALDFELSSENKITIYLMLKMRDESLMALENYTERIQNSERSNYLTYKFNPIYDFLRDEPRFQKLLSKHKEIYDSNWKKYGNSTP